MSNVISIYDEKVEVKRDVFTITIIPVPERDHAACIARARELMTESGIPKSRYKVEDFRTHDTG